jgi:hypothetical protein
MGKVKTPITIMFKKQVSINAENNGLILVI